MEMHNMPILSVFVKGQTFVFLEMEGENEEWIENLLTSWICSFQEFALKSAVAGCQRQWELRIKDEELRMKNE